MKKRLISLLVVVIFLVLGCSNVPLGDGSLEGRLPRGWHDSQRLDRITILRVTNDWVPVPFEIKVSRAPKDTLLSKQGAWVFLKEEKIPGPTVPLGDGWKKTERQVWVYVKRFEDGRVLTASVDTRFDKAKAEKFLNSLRFVR